MECVQVVDCTKPSCAWCYRVSDTLKACAKCSSRKYCSKECQVQDWKIGHHKQWCGKAGEKDVDYQFREAGEKGLGIFIMRGKEWDIWTYLSKSSISYLKAPFLLRIIFFTLF